MGGSMSPRKETRTSSKNPPATTGKSKGFTGEERAAMKERARELKAGKVDGEHAVLAKIASMPEPDRSMGNRLHAIVKANAPGLVPRLWYGMPAYSKEGKVLCFFQAAEKFKTRYASFAFTDTANLDDGALWPVAFGLKDLTPMEEARLGTLLKKAVS
jgi:hypothetical protein